LKKHRYKVSFFITALLYALPILLYLYLFRQAIVSVDKPNEERIELSLSQFVPEAPPAELPEPVQKEQLVEDEPEPEPEKKVEEEEKPEPEPEPEPEKEKEPVKEETAPLLKETPVVEPVKKVAPKPTKKKVKKPVKKQKKHKKKKRVARKRQVSGGGSPRHSAAQKNAFLARIRAKINRAKSYPRIAQRRGMQGIVHVRFTILSNGHVGKITMSGPKVFYRSAKKAIKRAFPVNVKSAPISLPTTVKLSLRYKLQ
jgi:protein TonB